MFSRKLTTGFTIVELLIVIVVIAILAAISVVSYNGIQQRSTNNAIIDSTSKTSRLIQSYIAANGSLPATTGSCITTDSGCATSSTYTTNSGFHTNMATIGAMPRSVPTSGATHYGIIYYYNAARMVDGTARPIVLLYWLQGTAQKCVLPGVVADPNASSTTTSTTGYTFANDSSTGKTLCAIAIPS